MVATGFVEAGTCSVALHSACGKRVVGVSMPERRCCKVRKKAREGSWRRPWRLKCRWADRRGSVTRRYIYALHLEGCGGFPPLGMTA